MAVSSHSMAGRLFFSNERKINQTINNSDQKIFRNTNLKKHFKRKRKGELPIKNLQKYERNNQARFKTFNRSFDQ